MNNNQFTIPEAKDLVNVDIPNPNSSSKDEGLNLDDYLKENGNKFHIENSETDEETDENEYDDVSFKADESVEIDSKPITTSDGLFDIGNTAAYLHEMGLIKEVPDGMNTEELDAVSFKKLIKFNLEANKTKALETASSDLQQDLASRLSPELMKMVELNYENPNLTNEELFEMLNESLNTTSYSASSDSSVVEAYYKSLGLDEDSSAVIIENLIQSGQLSNKAREFLPLIQSQQDKKVESVAKEHQALKKQEEVRYNATINNARSILSTGEIAGIPINRNDASALLAAISDNKTMVQYGNKKVEMGYTEALMKRAKLEGRSEDLLLSTLILQKGAGALKEYINQKTTSKKATKNFKGSGLKFGSKRAKQFGL